MTQAGVATYQRGDYETALREFRLLAQQGNASAQFNLGRMYGHGRRVRQRSIGVSGRCL
jgi:TPR repeat protein